MFTGGLYFYGDPVIYFDNSLNFLNGKLEYKIFK